jgi:hypothetical protein
VDVLQAKQERQSDRRILLFRTDELLTRGRRADRSTPRTSILLIINNGVSAMNEANVIAVETRVAERMRQSRPASAQDVLDLAEGLTELVHAVRALALRVAEIEKELPEFPGKRTPLPSAGLPPGPEEQG